MTATPTKKRLTLIVGAGASIRGSAPSVKDLTSDVLAMTSPRVIGDVGQYIAIEGGTPRYLGSSLRDPSEPAIRLVDRALRSIRETHNFEDLLHAVEVLEPYVAARTMLEELAHVRPILTAFTDPTPKYEALMNWSLLWRLRWDIIRLVRGKVIAGSDTASDAYRRDSDARLRTLRDAFVVNAFNLNYDDLFERSFAWHDGYGDPAGGWLAFDRAAYTSSIESNDHVMTHLHGSVRYGYIVEDPKAVRRDRPQRQVVKYATASDATPSLVDPPLPTYTDDVIDDAAPIVSGANKVLKFTTPPYSYYYAALPQAVHRNDRILCVGYGFADAHVNNWILEAIQHHGAGKVRLAVVDYRADGRDWPLGANPTFREICARLSVGSLDLDGPANREFVASGRVCVSLEGYPPREDIMRRIVDFLAEE